MYLYKYRKTLQKICLQCNKVFHPAVSEVKRGNGKFCSISCVYTYRNLHYLTHKPPLLENRICLFCKRTFPHRIYKGLGKYCSIPCKNNSLSGVQPGKVNQNVRRKWHNLAFSSYGEKCEICGYALSVDVHHLLPRSKGGKDDAENLSVLCPNHHREVHIGILTKENISKFRKELVEVEGSIPRPVQLS